MLASIPAWIIFSISLTSKEDHNYCPFLGRCKSFWLKSRTTNVGHSKWLFSAPVGQLGVAFSGCAIPPPQISHLPLYNKRLPTSLLEVSGTLRLLVFCPVLIVWGEMYFQKLLWHSPRLRNISEHRSVPDFGKHRMSEWLTGKISPELQLIYKPWMSLFFFFYELRDRNWLCSSLNWKNKKQRNNKL